MCGVEKETISVSLLKLVPIQLAHCQGLVGCIPLHEAVSGGHLNYYYNMVVM